MILAAAGEVRPEPEPEEEPERQLSLMEERPLGFGPIGVRWPERCCGEVNGSSTLLWEPLRTKGGEYLWEVSS